MYAADSPVANNSPSSLSSNSGLVACEVACRATMAFAAIWTSTMCEVQCDLVSSKTSLLNGCTSPKKKSWRLFAWSREVSYGEKSRSEMAGDFD